MTRIRTDDGYTIKPLHRINLTYEIGENQYRRLKGRFVRVKENRQTRFGLYSDRYLVFVSDDLRPGVYPYGKAPLYVLPRSAFPSEPRIKWNGNPFKVFSYIYRRIRDRCRTAKAHRENKEAFPTRSPKKNRLLKYAPGLISALEQYTKPGQAPAVTAEAEA
jgi:hypothetical protein